MTDTMDERVKAIRARVCETIKRGDDGDTQFVAGIVIHDIPWLLDLIESQQTRIAELEGHYDGLLDTASENLTRMADERDALESRIAALTAPLSVAERHNFRLATDYRECFDAIIAARVRAEEGKHD